MAEGMPKPKVISNIENYQKRLDNAGADPAPAPAAAPAPEPVHKPITVAEAQAKAAKYAKDREDFAATAKGMPKPGLMDRAKKLFGGD